MSWEYLMIIVTMNWTNELKVFVELTMFELHNDFSYSWVRQSSNFLFFDSNNHNEEPICRKFRKCLVKLFFRMRSQEMEINRSKN